MADHPLNLLLRHVRHLAGAGPEAEQNDRQLLHRFAANHDEDAFALLVRRHGAVPISDWVIEIPANAGC